ncbi:MAG: DUF2059 domain-containing protein [Pseudolabrys sp.]|jgi:hypothetical protein
MMKSLIAALIALSLICPGRADAQAQPDPEAVAAATELIITLRMPDQFRLTVPRTLQAMKWAVLQTRPKMERQFDAATPVVIEAMNARVMELLGPIADIYARNFTVNEMHQLVAFYRTPAGQKFLDKSSVVTEEMATVGQSIGHTIGREMHELMIEELRKQEEKL